MAKKPKLSSRELAAKKAGGTLNYKTGKVTVAPKVAPRVSTPKSVAPLVGAGPLLPGQVRVGSVVQGAGPLLPGQTRELASKAQAKKSSKNSGLSGGDGLTFGSAGGGTKTDLRGTLGNGLSSNSVKTGPAPDTIRAGGGGIFDRLLNKGIGAMGALGQQSYRNGVGMSAPGTFMSNAEKQGNINDIFGIKTASADDGMSRLGMALQKADTPDMPQAPGQSSVDDIFGSLGEPSLQTPFSPYRTEPTLTEPKKGKDWVDESGDVNNEYQPNIIPQSQDEISQQQNELFGGGQLPDVSTGTTGNRSGRGSGMFGTGKGVQADDPYIKELRKAYASNGGEKWLKKQFDELIAALDPTYAQMQKEGEDALQAQLLNNNTQLASVMNANNTGDSEQRAQLMAGQQRDTQTALGNLLAKLAQAKAQDVSGYKQKYAEQRGNLQEKNQSNAQRLLEQIQQYRNRQEDMAYKNASLSGRQEKAPKNMSLKAIKFDKFGNEIQWVDQSTGDIYENSDF